MALLSLFVVVVVCVCVVVIADTVDIYQVTLANHSKKKEGTIEGNRLARDVMRTS